MALIRRAASAGAFAAVARRGDRDAGALVVKVFVDSERVTVWTEGRDDAGERVWRDPLNGPQHERDVDAWLEKEIAFDSDLWIVEIEDREGRAFLD